ncbi:hypothetical protein BD410DRAFT_796008 [Rickenella mellea]|uniref:BTB domain-containing protein n=1 Tax=Rickenella mellea TaxID=50990 RepID=A0A4Y7PKQ0_9AGAM|nr:hypothetical protein BD410DRAFT_796008 [Rickenella mellea]
MATADFTPEIPPLHHESIYFQDGDIILSALNDDGSKILFRAHKFILAHHSPVFMGMFTLPQPQATIHEGHSEVEGDGIQEVEMPDRAEDLASLLSVLYDPSKLPYKHYNPDTPLLVKGILTLATKYEIERLRDRIIEHIKLDWPTTLVEWDAIQAHNNQFAENSATSGLHEGFIQLEPAAAIDIARRFDIPSILPAAFLQLSRTPARNRWDGMNRPNDPKVHHARWDLLSQNDLLCLLQGTQTLFASKTVKLISHDVCLNHPQCGEILDRELECVRSRCVHSQDFLEELKTFTSTFSDNNNKLCALCTGPIRPLLINARQRKWAKLSKYFNLRNL